MEYSKGLRFLLLVILFIGCSRADHHGSVTGIVTFNMKGVKGTIKFEPLSNGSMRITSDLSGFDVRHGWHVHILPVDYSLSPAARCENANIGLHFDPFNALSNPDYSTDCSPDNISACEVGDLSGKLGTLSPRATYIDDDPELTLFGRYGIIGRSIKIHGMEDVCGTILSSSEYGDDPKTVTLLRASFIYPFGGSVYFRQVEGESVTIWGKVYWTKDNAARTEGHKWHIHVNKPGAAYRVGDCSAIGGHFNPFNVNISSPNYKIDCNPMNLANCEVGDLNNKLEKINIPIDTAEYNSDAFFFQDSFLNLTGVNAVIDRSLAIHSIYNNTPVQGCAPLVAIEELSVSTTGDYINAMQTSKFDRTKISPIRSSTDEKFNFDKSDFSVFSNAFAPNELCQDAFEGGVSKLYNPHSAPHPDGTDNTPDKYPVGNLTAKYSDVAKGGYFNDLPIQGIETIAGRSMGISYTDDDGSTVYTCRTLKPTYPTGATVKMAKASFKEVIEGAFYFTQQDFGDGVYGDTYIIIDIWYKNASMNMTTGHNYHIHETPPVDGMACVDSIGGHFNPFMTDISPTDDYKSKCNPNTPLRCESGDLSLKHGQISVGPSSSTRQSYAFTDPNLNLFGPEAYSIIGRSVGIHLISAHGGDLFECGEIVEVYESSEPVSVTFDYNENFNRAEFARSVSNMVEGASPSDIVLDSQTMTKSASGSTGCVDASLRVLGTSESDANTKAANVRSSFSSDCNSSSDMVRVSFVILLSALVATAALLI